MAPSWSTCDVLYSISHRSWVDLIWKYSSGSSLSMIENLPLVPVQKGNQLYYRRLQRFPKVMLSTYQKKSKITDSIKNRLLENGIEFATENVFSSVALNNQQFLDEYILLPTETGILNGLRYLKYHYVSLSDRFCIDFKKIIEDSNKIIEDSKNNILSYIYDMNIFTDIRNRKVSIRSSHISEKKDIPPGFSQSPCSISLVLTSSVGQRLQDKLSFRRMAFNDLTEHYLACHKTLTITDSKFFIEKISSTQSISSDIISKLKPKVRIKTKSGGAKSVDSLFERTSKTEAFFDHEKDSFPDGCYNIAGLRMFGLKSEFHISEPDIHDRISYVTENYKSMDSEGLGRKVEAILSFCLEKRISFSRSTKWIPIEKALPMKYPTSLPWKARADNIVIESLKNIYPWHYFEIAGSTTFVISQNLSEIFSKLKCDWPSLDEVLTHLQIVERSYNADERGRYRQILMSIYRYLGETFHPNLVAVKWKQLSLKLWQGNQFIEPGRITLLKDCLNLSPYVYSPRGDLPDSFIDILKDICDPNKSKLELYIHVLLEIKQHYDKVNDYSEKDLGLAIQMLRFIAANYSQLTTEQKESIYVPIEYKFLKFFNTKECFYHDHADTLSSSEVQNHKITHGSIDNNIIKMFEIPDLVSEILNDDENDVFEDWGQTEPLTLRLNRLLKDYEDGLPIFKELIQNADDAGASEIKFLYDERSNDHLKSHLIDQSMKQWQGPALWVYNDAAFTKEDFENIRRLNAGTKESDTTKIGKFGLGFNAVYHLTDVPCFLSGNYILYFDPHSRYLGRALRSKSECGKRIDLRKNKALIPFNDQFKIFDGIFKARIDFKESNFESYNHTLFRLPLRNNETASKSDICNLNYTSHEMKLLLDKLKQSLDTLILFTENIKKVSVYHLEKNAALSKMTSMFSVWKETNKQPSESLLVAATKQMKKNKPGQQSTVNSLTSTRLMDIDMLICFNEHCDTKPIKETWLQLAFTGSQKNISFAKANKGLVPCGGVAINYRRLDERFEILKDKNKVFCFLPLPRGSNLPVSVNGAFLITNDRKQLAATSSEVKYNTNDWNIMLAKDIGNAYFDLLSHLKSKFSQWKVEDWFALFPMKGEINYDVFNKAILTSLVNTLISSDKQIFPVENENGYAIKWVKWQDICRPPKELPQMNHDIRKFMNWYFQERKVSKVCLNLPQNIKHLVKSYVSVKPLDNLHIKEKELFDMFFKSLLYVPKKIVDNMMLAMLSQQPEKGSTLRNYLESTQCIPTLPSRKLKRPQDLVKKDSTAGQLYDIEDEAFPCQEYMKLWNHELFLEKLGMSTEYLQWNKIISKAREITGNNKKQDDNLLLNRSRILLELMNRSLGKCTESQKTEIAQISFLPVKSTSKDSNQIPWYGQGRLFCSANEAYISHYVNIVSSSAPILDCEMDNALAKFLGVDRVPTFEEAVAQVEVIELKYKFLTGKRESPEICKILCDLFTFFFDNYQSESSHQLVSKNMIYDNDRKYLANPNEIFFDSSDELVKVPGYIYKVASDLTDNWKIRSFLQNIGVKELPSTSDYIMALQNIKAKCRSEPVPKSLLLVIINNVIPQIARSNSSLVASEEIYVPDDKSIMQKTTSVCFKDADWISKRENVIFAHPEISYPHCERLGIKRFRKQHVLDSSIGIGFGQHENLTKRIQNLLHGYTEEDIIKELLQNADDSKATEVKFILDCRNHSTRKVLSDEWKELQGPALIVTNNGEFTNNDLEAIQKLGEGNKGRDRLKTGRYGVGFNAVYNITDCPSLHVRLQDQAYLCIFDPHLHYNIGGTIEKPGRRIDSDVIKKDYGDMYEAHLLTGNNMPNTLFRLPLRTKKMADKSKISKKETTVNAIESYFRNIYQYIGDMLLFLMNIKKVKFSILKMENNKLRETSEKFKAFKYDFKPSDFDTQSKVILSNYVRNPSSKSVATGNYNTCVQHLSNSVNCCEKHYLLVEQIGFSEIKTSGKIKCDTLKEFFTFPKGAVASTLSGVKCINCPSMERRFITCTLKGKTYRQGTVQNVFSTLPISTPSGLPVLVNGNFLLEYETRREMWVSLSGPERTWNYGILSQCVLPCYIFLLNQLKKNALENEVIETQDLEKQQQEIYKFFPKCIEEKDRNYWHYFSFLFYNEIFARNEEILSVACNNKKLLFSCPRDQFIVYVDENIKPTAKYLHHVSTESSQKPVLLKVLQNVGLHIDLIPTRIAENFKESGNPLTHISPALIRDRLKKISHDIIAQNGLAIKQSKFKDSSSLSTVFEYCMKDINEALRKQKEKELPSYFANVESEFIGLPLCLLADNTVSMFSNNNPVFVSRFSSIFQRNQAKFVHEKLVSRLEKYEFSNILRRIKLQNFVEMLPDELNEGKFKGKFIMKFGAQNEIKKFWLNTVWEFLKSFKKDLDKHLEEWLLLPARLNSVEFLLPVSQKTSVLYLEAAEDKCAQVIGVLRELPVYEVAERDFVDHNYSLFYQKAGKIYPQEFKKDFFGSINKIEDLENALLFSQDHNEWTLSMRQARIILDHLENLWFNEHFYSTKIHNLSIFIKYDGTLTKIDREAVVLPESDIPYDGLDIIEEHMQITFIKAGYTRIFQKVGCQVVTIFKFYIGFIFPHLHLLPQPAIMNQMSYIKFMFSGPLSFHSQKDEVKTFIERLSNLKFIPVQEGVLRAPCELYDPHVQLFKLVFKEEYFPPSDFSEGSWLAFLRKIGLITEFSKELLIQIAGLIQDLDEKNVVEASQMLCEKIKMKEFAFDDTFLHQIRCIKFLIPKQIRKINEKIYRSLNKSTSRMCYNGSVHYSQENLVWTSKLILPSYACCFESRDTYVMLGVKQGLKGKKFRDEPRVSFEDVLKHIDNLTNNTNYKARTMTCKTIPEIYRQQYKCVLEELYEFLQQSRPLEYKHVELLSQRSVILVNDNANLDIPGRSNLSNHMKLPPYINEVHVIWGKYFELFKEMGCQQSSNASQFLDVLKEIKSTVVDKHLTPNELTIVSKVVSNMSGLLKKSPLENNVKTQVYLPCIKRFHPKPLEPVYILPSSELIYIDDYHMQERMKDFEGNFMLSKYEGVEGTRNVNENLLSGLPTENMPKLLSDLVQEVLKEPISEVEAPIDHFSKKMSMILSSAYFFHGLERLIKYEYKTHNKDLPVLENIFEIIRSVKISVLHKVQTNLIYNKKVISDSETNKEVYTRATKNSFEIYLQVDELTDASTKIIAHGILDLLGLYSIKFDQSKNAIVLLNLLEVPSKKIPQLLDNFGIPRETSDAELRFLPSPGDLVPQTLYPYLSNNFEEFQIEEFVAISREFEGAECYVFGIIKGCENNESAHVSQLVYDVQVDEDPVNLVKFTGFDLYGFDRSVQSSVLTKEIIKSDDKERREQAEVPQPQSYEDAIKEIRDVLRSLSGLDEESKKKVIRKLYLKWHPDKHEERNKDFATRIFQSLLNELKSDHKDFENNFDSWNFSARTYSYFTRSNSGFSHFGSNSSPNFSDFFRESANNPQPAQSRRWYRQAEKDLQAAKDCKEQNADSFFQWHCFMAKQVYSF